MEEVTARNNEGVTARNNGQWNSQQIMKGVTDSQKCWKV
jgi:hypothetical protein